jgi:hypothetical protein
MNDASSPKVEITGSRLFTQWLAQQKASLAFTTYQAGKLFLLGLPRWWFVGLREDI